MVSIHDLPPEILFHVWQCLTGPAPSECRLHDQPSHTLLQADTEAQNLKSVSLVDKKWRASVLPLLFRNVLWQPCISSLNAFSLTPIPLLRFLLDNQLEHYVITFTMVLDFANDEAEIDASRLPQQIPPADLEWLWDRLFSIIDPLRLTIIAPPTTLAAVLNRMLFLGDAWSFEIPYHILSLARSERKRPGENLKYTETEHQPFESDVSSLTQSDQALLRAAGSSSMATPAASCKGSRPALPCPLFNLRPWTSVLLNEGSSIRAYQTYEFFLRSPPSMLGALLGIEEYPNDTQLLPPTVTDFNYIAIFPMSSHVSTLTEHLPKIDRLFIQLTPRPDNPILRDQNALRYIELEDLWMERNSAYSDIFEQLTIFEGPSNWRTLKVFESGDAADKESWNLFVKLLESARTESWKVETEGVLARLEDGSFERPLVVEQHVLGGGTVARPLFFTSSR
jgi:hypothetical protein